MIDNKCCQWYRHVKRAYDSKFPKSALEWEETKRGRSYYMEIRNSIKRERTQLARDYQQFIQVDPEKPGGCFVVDLCKISETIKRKNLKTVTF